MTHEIEIKLRVAPDVLRGVTRLAWLRAMMKGPAKRRRLVSVYFDTPGFKLRENGVALRVRRVGRQRLQTIKTEVDGREGAFARREWEHPIVGDRPDFDAAQDTALAPLATAKLRRRIGPVFETEIWRTAILLRSGGSLLELAIDRGEIRAGRRRERVGEIEIELKQGDAAEVTRLAERIAGAIPAAYEGRTKSDRGYALAAGGTDKVVFAAPVRLEREMTADVAFRVIGFACLHHLTANERAVRNRESEGVHQMRVGLRRLRSAISLFRDMVQDSEAEAIKTELRWLTEQLGPARDLDVFVRESVMPLAGAPSGGSEIEVLQKEFEGRRDEGFARAKAAVESERYRRLVLKIVLWLAGGAWSTTTDVLRETCRRQPVADFAAEVLSARTQKITKEARKLDELDMHERHKLRIGIKKLRYATEFFENLFTGGKAKERQKRLAKTLKELQEALGKLNDFTMHQKLAGEIVERGKHPDRRPEKAYAMGLVAGHEQGKVEDNIATARKAGSRLSARRQFWD